MVVWVRLRLGLGEGDGEGEGEGLGAFTFAFAFDVTLPDVTLPDVPDVPDDAYFEDKEPVPAAVKKLEGNEEYGEGEEEEEEESTPTPTPLSCPPFIPRPIADSKPRPFKSGFGGIYFPVLLLLFGLKSI